MLPGPAADHQLVATLARRVVTTASYDFKQIVAILFTDGLLGGMVDGREFFNDSRGLESIALTTSASSRVGLAMQRATAGQRGVLYRVLLAKAVVTGSFRQPDDLVRLTRSVPLAATSHRA